MEALSGIGTCVGSCLCLARVPSGEPKLWDYGVVVGYSWREPAGSNVLHCVFPDGPADVPFDENSLLDFAPETYALRPCYRRAVCDVMPREMVTLNEKRIATLMAPVPLFDLESSSVVKIRIQYILDYVYYKEGRHRVPQSVQFGFTIFDDNIPDSAGMGSGLTTTLSRTAELLSNSTPVPFLIDQLNDSDVDDSVDASANTLQTPRIQTVTGKRKRVGAAVSDELASGDAELVRLLDLKETVGVNSALAGDIDQLISFKKTALGLGSGSDLIARASESSSNFRPTDTQRVIHHHLVNGKFVSLSP
ncbi:hypothetical protein PI125_g19778 [Phytophthora idaei]|nr:hypothetical protein PI125_g19778 [Phytophthora idaei]